MENKKRLIKPETIKLELAFIGCEPKHLAAVDRCATVDAVEVVHGRWIPLEYDGYADGNPVWDLWECSECQEEHSGDEDTLTPYCPYCGAKMDGGNEDG